MLCSDSTFTLPSVTQVRMYMYSAEYIYMYTHRYAYMCTTPEPTHTHKHTLVVISRAFFLFFPCNHFINIKNIVLFPAK
jgi:hypothetical protein